MPDRSTIRARVREIVLTHAGSSGMSASAVIARMGPDPTYTKRTREQIVREVLTDLTECRELSRCRMKNNSGFRYCAPGVMLDLHPSEYTNDGRDRDWHETPEQAKALEKLFAICPVDYSHGNIISLEPGRVGLRPETLTAGRVSGAW